VHRTVFDATVLCGALVRPTGQNWRLLAFAAESPVLDGFTTDVAGLEFVRNALDGISGNVYSLHEVEEFLDVFEPLFDPDNVAESPIGRSLLQRTDLHNKPIGEVAYELTGRTREDLLADLESQPRLMDPEFDYADLHIVISAVEHGAEIICSSNRRDLPEGPIVPGIEVMGPGRLSAMLGLG
jgi:hypothetical protein